MSDPSVAPLAMLRSLADEAELAAATFLARYSGRTLDAYRQDLRWYFQWIADRHLDVLAAARGHIELYRHEMEQRGLAPSTIDRRLSTVCGFYRFAHIDGLITSNPAQYVRRPKVHPTNERGLDRTRTRPLPLRSRTTRSPPRRLGGAARAQRVARHQSLRHQH